MLNNKGQIVIFADKATFCEKSGKKMSSLVRTLIEDAISLVTIVGE